MSLIEKMSSADFEPERYADEYRERALAMIEKKVEGQEIKAVAPGNRDSLTYTKDQGLRLGFVTNELSDEKFGCILFMRDSQDSGLIKNRKES